MYADSGRIKVGGYHSVARRLSMVDAGGCCIPHPHIHPLLCPGTVALLARPVPLAFSIDAVYGA